MLQCCIKFTFCWRRKHWECVRCILHIYIKENAKWMLKVIIKLSGTRKWCGIYETMIWRKLRVEGGGRGCGGGEGRGGTSDGYLQGDKKGGGGGRQHNRTIVPDQQCTTSCQSSESKACDAVKNAGIGRKHTVCDVDGTSFGEFLYLNTIFSLQRASPL